MTLQTSSGGSLLLPATKRAPVVLQQLQHKEDSYRAAHPSWMDQEEAPADIRKQWQKARANRRMQFKVGNYRDGDRESSIRMLTGTIKADWIQLPVERLSCCPSYIETRCHCWSV